MSGNAATSLRCFECGTEWDQPLTETLTAPVCPKCGNVGDRELSIEYPAGVLAGRSAATRQRSGRFASNDIRYRDGDHPSQTQFTPPYVFEPACVDLGGLIGLDPCTTEDNPLGAVRFYTIEDDGLTQPWQGPEQGYPFRRFSPEWRSIFVNPPYSKAREPWVKLCIEAGGRGQKVILLIPAATDTRIFQEAASTSTAVVFIKGRVKFGTLRPNRRQHAASHPSALIGWNTDLEACSVLGWRTHGKP